MLSDVLAVFLSWLLVSGHVRDSVTRAPIAGITVQVLGTAEAAITDVAGRFSVNASRGSRLRLTGPGYAPHELDVVGDAELAVYLVPAARSLEAVAVTAIRGEGSAPISQRVLQKAELEERYFGQDTPLLLTFTPSVTSYADAGSFANYSYLRLRGLDMSRINITVDGVPLNDSEDQFVYFSNFPDFGNSIESVQVQRGVGTSSLGTASYAGSISFESIALASASRGGELQFGGGSYGSYRGSAEYQTGLGRNRTSFYGRYSAHRTDGYRYHSGNRSRSYFLSGGYFGERNIAKITAFGGASKNELAYLAASEADIRRDPRTNPLTDAERDDFSQHFASASYTRVLGPSSSLSATGYTVTAGGDYDVFIVPNLFNFNLASAVYGLLGTWNRQRGRLKVSAGGHANTYHRDHFLAVRPDLDSRVYFNTGHKREASAFTKMSVEARSVTLFGDLQVRWAEFRYEPDRDAGVPSSRIGWSFFNPKVGVSIRASPVLSFNASLGRNGREPARNDMFAGFDNVDTSNVEFVGPLERVRPESVTDYETGVSYRSPALSVDANLYWMDFRDEITPVGALSYIGLPLRKNVAASVRRGLELDVTYRGLPGVIAAFNAAMSYNRIREYTDDATGRSYRDVEPLLTPRLVSNQSLRYALGGAVVVALNGRYVGRSFLNNTSNGEFVTPESFALDGGVEWKVGRHAVLVHGNNLTSARVYTSGYTDGSTSYYYLQAPRNVFVTARIAY